jgi:hypothetical protein
VYLFLLLGLPGLIVCIIVAVSTSKRKTVEVPLCRRHRNHWLARQLLMLGSFCSLIPVVVLAAFLSQSRFVGEWIWFGVVLGFVGWILFAVIVHVGMIRSTLITEDTITLQGVSRDFKDALKEWRREDDERDREREERRRRDKQRRRRDEEDWDSYRRASDEDRPRRPRDEYRAEES